MEKRDKLTPEQRAVVDWRGGTLLVSAAAGSGKTHVLVERLLRQLTEPGAEAEIDDYLIITYTNAAAAELRGKILEAIGGRLRQEPHNRRLRRQQMLCGRAHIGTIHAFCVSLLRENAAQAGLSPDFRVAEQSESDLMRQRTAEELLEACYEDMTPAFAALLDILGVGRDDRALSELLLTTYERLQSHPDPEEWCESCLRELNRQDVRDLGETPWGRELMDYAEKRSAYLGGLLDKILADCPWDPKLEKAYGPFLRESRAALGAFHDALAVSWDAAQALAVIPFARPNPLRGEGYEEVKALRERAKKGVEEFPKLFSAPSAPLLGDMAAAAPAVTELLRLTLAFGERYRAAKRKRNVVDFSDLEHLSLLLLRGENGERSPLAEQVAARFREVMVDEYQDVNPVQERILRCLDRNNLFLVGDMKQSIYRFRLADPGIFLQKYRSYPPAVEAREGEPAKLLLSRNFRSREGILEAVNFVFRSLMSPEVGEMDYTPAEYLYYGASYPPSEEPTVEMDLLTLPEKEGEEESPDRLRLEADHVARRIRELKERMTVAEGEGTRPARWSDFAILLRTNAGRAEIYAEALAAWGIPLAREGEDRFFEEPEICFVLSLLSVIDNPRQDIPLISVLRSPVYGFGPNDLAEIRAQGKEDFYDALCRAGETRPKCAAFLEELEELRRRSPEESSDRLIWHIYNRTDLLGIYGAMPDGEERRRRLLLLFQYARSFEDSGFKGLFPFITDLRERMERGDRLPRPAAAVAGDAVQLMSIHKSKGLQFPVVLLPDLCHLFNRKDLQQNLLLHRDLGPGARVVDYGRRIRFDTVPHRAIARRIWQETLSEELRVLYVAMTRAREKLILSAAYPEKKREKLAPAETLPLDPHQVAEGRCFADWLTPVLMKADPLCRVNWVPLGQPAPAAPEAEPLPSRAPAAPERVEEIRQRLSYVYPYALAENLPSKLSPTELKGRLQDSEAALEAGEAPRLRGLRRRQGEEPRRPDFAAPAALSAAQRGTAFHTLMQSADWDLCRETAGVRAELDRLLGEKLLTPGEAATVDPETVSRFCRSPEGRAAAIAGDLKREFKFSVLLPAELFFVGAPEDRILLQGVVDAFFSLGEGLAVLDFKTDRVTGEEAPERARSYRGQLDAYAAALESITGKTVTHEILYFTHPGRAVYLKGAELDPTP